MEREIQRLTDQVSELKEQVAMLSTMVSLLLPARDGWIKQAQAARKLGVTSKTMALLAKREHLTVRRSGGSVLYKVSEVDKYVNGYMYRA